MLSDPDKRLHSVPQAPKEPVTRYPLAFSERNVYSPDTPTLWKLLLDKLWWFYNQSLRLSASPASGSALHS